MKKKKAIFLFLPKKEKKIFFTLKQYLALMRVSQNGSSAVFKTAWGEENPEKKNMILLISEKVT